MAFNISKATARFLNLTVKVDLSKFSPIQKKNLIKFLKTRQFAQTYSGIAEIAFKILKKYHLNVLHNKGSYISFSAEDYTPKFQDALQKDFSLFLLKEDVNTHSPWMQHQILKAKEAFEKNELPQTNLFFMRGMFYNTKKIMADPLPENHPISQLIKQIENNELNYIEIDWR